MIGYLVYSMFFKKAEQTNTLISGATGLNNRSIADTQILGNQITQALVQIESLKLDRAIFTNPIYQSLIDKSQPISPQPAGRKNPFAPLSDTSVNYTVEGDAGVMVPEQTEEVSTEGALPSDEVPAEL